MHDLEVIIALNQQAEAKATKPVVPEMGWNVVSNGRGIITVSGHGHSVVVDCSNPLVDADLVRFHQEFTDVMPKWVLRTVENMASQHRRFVVVTGRWAECQREAEAHRKTPTRNLTETYTMITPLMPDVEPVEHIVTSFIGRKALFDPRRLIGQARQVGNVICIRLDCEHPYDEFWLQFQVIMSPPVGENAQIISPERRAA